MRHHSGHKAQIAARFGAAADRYAEASELQRCAARELAQLVRSLSLSPSPRILEIGCGTGYLTSLLQGHLRGEWIVTDIAPQMVRACARQNLASAHYVVMDGERPAVRPGSLDLIVSNFAAQWFSDLRSALSALGNLLAPGGQIAIATLGRATFSEWRAAHNRHGLDPATHDYPDAELLATCFPTGQITRVHAHRIVQTFPEPLDFLRGLRIIGAHTPRPEAKPLSAGQMRKVLRELATPAGPFNVTYEVLYAISRRPEVHSD